MNNGVICGVLENGDLNENIFCGLVEWIPKVNVRLY